MSDRTVILLALGILLAVVLLIAGVASFIFWYHRRPSPEPTLNAGPQGPVAQIPTKQVSVVRSDLPWLALGQYAVRGTLSVRPDGMTYTRFLREPKHHPFASVRLVEPHLTRATQLTIHLTSGWGIVVLTGTPHGRHLAVAELSRWCRIAPYFWGCSDR